MPWRCSASVVRKFVRNTSASFTSRCMKARPTFGADIEGNAALVAVDGQIVATLIADKWRRPLPRIITDAGLLNLGDIGAQIAQNHRRVRTSQRLRLIHYLDSAERRTFARHDPIALTRTCDRQCELAIITCQSRRLAQIGSCALTASMLRPHDKTGQGNDYSSVTSLHPRFSRRPRCPRW